MTAEQPPPTVRREWHDRVFEITIDRPDRRNALNHETLDAVSGAIEEAVDANARVVVLGGAGGFFCAGADLATVRDPEFVPRLRGVLEALRGAPMPTMASITGPALGAGTQLAVACDLRIASPDAEFAVPAGRLGLTVDEWTIRQVATAAGDSLARGLLLGGLTASAEDAHRSGFVHRLGSHDDALEWAAHVARLAPLTLAAHKVGLNEVADGAVNSDRFAAARELAWNSNDLAEGLAAFAERRPARFGGT